MLLRRDLRAIGVLQVAPELVGQGGAAAAAAVLQRVPADLGLQGQANGRSGTQSAAGRVTNYRHATTHIWL